MKNSKLCAFILVLALIFVVSESALSQEKVSGFPKKSFLEMSNLEVAFGIGSFSNKVFEGQTSSVPQMDIQGIFRYEPKAFQPYVKLKFGLYKLGPAKTDGSFWDEHSNFLKIGPGIGKKIHLSKKIVFRPNLEGNYLIFSGFKKERKEDTNADTVIFDDDHSDFAPEFGFTLLFSKTVDLSYSYRLGDQPFHYVSFRHSPLFKDGMTPKVYYEFFKGEKHQAIYAGVWWPVGLKGGAKGYNLKKERLVKKDFWSKTSFHLYMGEIVAFTVGSFIFLALMGATWAS